MKNLIGVSKPRRGFFVYKNDSKVGIQVNKAIYHGLWHQWIGHPSNQAFPKVSDNIQLDTSSKNKDKFCDICLRLNKLVYLSILVKIKPPQCFDLIHCDMWSGYGVKSSCSANNFLTILDDPSRGVWTYVQENSTTF